MCIYIYSLYTYIYIAYIAKPQKRIKKIPYHRAVHQIAKPQIESQIQANYSDEGWSYLFGA